MVEEELIRPVEEMENVELVEGNPSKTTIIKRRNDKVPKGELECLCMEPRRYARYRR